MNRQKKCAADFSGIIGLGWSFLSKRRDSLKHGDFRQESNQA
jgi:hypothetical protein